MPQPLPYFKQKSLFPRDHSILKAVMISVLDCLCKSYQFWNSRAIASHHPEQSRQTDWPKIIHVLNNVRAGVIERDQSATLVDGKYVVTVHHGSIEFTQENEFKVIIGLDINTGKWIVVLRNKRGDHVGGGWTYEYITHSSLPQFTTENLPILFAELEPGEIKNFVISPLNFSSGSLSAGYPCTTLQFKPKLDSNHPVIKKVIKSVAKNFKKNYVEKQSVLASRIKTHANVILKTLNTAENVLVQTDENKISIDLTSLAINFKVVIKLNASHGYWTLDWLDMDNPEIHQLFDTCDFPARIKKLLLDLGLVDPDCEHASTVSLRC